MSPFILTLRELEDILLPVNDLQSALLGDDANVTWQSRKWTNVQIAAEKELIISNQ
jgi:hypothetical protein